MIDTISYFEGGELDREKDGLGVVAASEELLVDGADRLLLRVHSHARRRYFAQEILCTSYANN